MIKRVRWVPVLGLLVFIEFIIILILLQPFGDGCDKDKDVCILNSWVEPGTIKAGDEGGVLKIKIKNTGNVDLHVNVSAMSREGIAFVNRSDEENTIIRDSYEFIAPGGIRVFEFAIKAENDAHSGKYLFDILVTGKTGKDITKDTTVVIVEAN